jgi:hypothetical protein
MTVFFLHCLVLRLSQHLNHRKPRFLALLVLQLRLKEHPGGTVEEEKDERMNE